MDDEVQVESVGSMLACVELARAKCMRLRPRSAAVGEQW